MTAFDNVVDVYALSPMQEGMLYHTITEPNTGVFINQISTRLEGELDIERFQTAWDELIESHEALRAAFIWDGVDVPVQVIRESVDLNWHVESFATLSANDQDEAIARFLDADRARGFDLARPPLMRMSLFELGPGSWQWVWTHHHMILDGWSTQLLLGELKDRYARTRSGSPTRFRYRDFVAWLGKEDEAESASFWKERLAGFADPFRIAGPGLVATPGASGPGTVVTAASSSLTRDVVDAARRLRVTSSSWAAGAWGIVLSRWARQRDVVFGVTVSGRPPELDGADWGVGLFINTLPLRLDVDPDLSVEEWLRRVQASQLEITSRPATSLSSIQRLSDVPEGDPLFETIFVFENYPTERPGSQPEDLAFVERRHIEKSNYPLALLVLPGEHLKLHFIFDRDRIGDEAVRSLGRQMIQALEQMVAHPTRRLADISVVDVEEKETLLRLGGGGVLASDDHRISDLIGRHFEDTPAAPAIAHAGGEISYGELDQRSSSLASRLAEIAPEGRQLIGVYTERSPEMIVAILAVIRAGCAYVPLDPSYPREHIRRIIEDEGVRTVVTQTSLEAELFADVTTLPIDGRPGGREPAEATPDDLVYLIHTSGSTGRPKGVMVSHRNLVSSTMARDSVYQVAPGRFLLLSPFAFDSSVVGIFWTLCAGGTIVLPGPDVERDLEAVIDLVKTEKVTHLLALPALYGLILDAAGPGDLDSLRVAIVAGESCSGELARKHHGVLGESAALYNEYGPTEATVWATAHRVSPEDDPVPIGRPIPGASVRVVDPEGQLTPLGFPGELWIGGGGVSKGYRGLPEETKRSFIAIDNEAGLGRYYRTGDLVAQREDGSLLFLGRADRQVKVRGHRIEVAAVESVLSGMHGVTEAVVVASRAGGGSGHRLIGYVVGQGTDAEDIRSTMHRSVPPHMVPDTLEVVDHVPRLPNGKVDYRSLERLDLERVLEQEDLDGPTTSTESKLAEIWRELLDLDKVGVHQSFFDLGGDSIIAIRLVSRARQRGIPIEPADVAAFPTISSMSAAVDGRETDQRQPEFENLIPINTEGTRTPLICLHAAGGNVMPFRILADRLGPDQPVYAFTARGVDGRAAPIDSIPEMARIYIEELRRALPNGPYRLLGDCLGGCIAHEMTAQLEAGGQTVEKVVVIDGALPWADSRAVTKLDKARRAVRNEGLIGLAKGLGRVARRKTETVLGASLGSEEARVRANRQRVIEASLVAFGRFEPDKVEAPLLLIRASEDPRDSDGMYWHMDWQGHAGEMETVFVDADHTSILHEPAVRQVAETLRR